MITLTTVPQVQSVLGGNTPVGYDKFVVGSVTFDSINKIISAQLRLTSTTNTQMEPILGQLVIRHATSEAILTFTTGVQFHRRLLLSSPQVAAIQTLIDDARTDIESGLIGVGLVAGTQSAGT